MEKKKLHGAMLITTRDIQLILRTSCERTAQQDHKLVRDGLGKNRKRLTIKQYCDYWELDLEDTLNFLALNG